VRRRRRAPVRALPLLAVLFACAMAFRVSVYSAAAQKDGAKALSIEENSAFRVEAPADQPALAAALLKGCNQARGTLAKQSEVAFPFQVSVIWCETEKEFRDQTGFRTENVAAAASASAQRIWINGPAWRRGDPADNQRVLVHEYSHVVVGSLAKAPPPRWLDEGLAMHLSGEWSFASGAAAARAQLFGGIPALATLEREFPSDPEAMRRAYLASYLGAEHLAIRLGAQRGRVDPILERLRDPARAAAFAASLRTPEILATIEADLHGSLGASVRRWIIVLSSGSTLFVFITLLFLYAWWRRHHAARQAAERESAEEPWAESLTQADIEEIYGEPRDTVDEDADEDE